ncbi:MAG: right-handed parallel beta-helix repeat-containing protein [Treponema sp.]|nr:right-handed parallel beta-helix repeat-containing protein [Treponema sp.]
MKKNLFFVFYFLAFSAASFASIRVTAKNCPKTNDLPNFLLKAAKEADKTLIIDGSDGIFKSEMLYFTGDEINIIGENNAVIDFSPTMFIDENLLAEIRKFMIENNKWMIKDYSSELDKKMEASAGIYLLKAKKGSIKNLKVMKAQFAGICLSLCENIVLENIESCYNHYQGFRLVGKIGSKKTDYTRNIRIRNCYSHGNYDDFTLGEEGDGFFIAQGAKDIILEDCVADCNSDDGFDTCNALGNIIFKRCAARYNGFSEEMVLSGKADNILTNSKCQRANNKEKGALDLACDGGGFGSPFWGTTFGPKVLAGGAASKPQDFLEPVSFYECCAINNYGDGFTRRSAPNPVYIENCYSVGNGLDNYRLACSIASTEKFMTYGIKVESIVKNSFQRRSTFGNDINKGSGIAKVDESKISIKTTNKTPKKIMKELQFSFPFKSAVNEYIEAKR